MYFDTFKSKAKNMLSHLLFGGFVSSPIYCGTAIRRKWAPDGFKDALAIFSMSLMPLAVGKAVVDGWTR
jgi:hypothetical protein